MLKYLIHFYRYQPFQVGLLLVLMTITGLLQGVGLLLLIPLLALTGLQVPPEHPSWWVQWLVVHHVQLSLGLVLVLFVMIIAISAMLTYWTRLKAAALQLGFSRLLGSQLYNSLMTANWRFMLKQRQADFTNLFSQSLSRVGVATQKLLQLISSLILIGVYGGVALYLSWQITLVVFAVGVLLIGMLLPFYRQAQKQGHLFHSSAQACYRVLLNFWHGLKLTKSLALEDYQVQRFEQAQEQLQKQQYAFMCASAKSSMLFQIAAVIVFAAIFYCGWHWLSMPLATLLIMLVVFARLLPKLNEAQRDLQQLLNVVPAFNELQQYFVSAADAEDVEDIADSPVCCQAMTLVDAVVRYDDQRLPSLKGISCSILANQTTAVVGPSGAGKSTLADVLAGLIEPDEGQVLIDGMPCTPSQLKAWRQQVGYMTQEPMLFDDSILHNVTLGQSFSDAAIWQALELAQVAAFVKALPEQLNTNVGDRGLQLSGGERQRIALARILLRKPKLLILDEATSQIDQENERYLQISLESLQGRMTILVITHRPSFLSNADQVIELREGTCVFRGTADELIKRQ